MEMKSYLNLKYLVDLGIRTISTGTAEFLNIEIKQQQKEDSLNGNFLGAEISFYRLDTDLYGEKEIQLFQFTKEQTITEQLDIAERIIEYLMLSMDNIGTKEYTESEFTELLLYSKDYLR